MNKLKFCKVAAYVRSIINAPKGVFVPSAQGSAQADQEARKELLTAKKRYGDDRLSISLRDGFPADAIQWYLHEILNADDAILNEVYLVILYFFINISTYNVY